MAYARHFIASAPGRLAFVAYDLRGRIVDVPFGPAQNLIATIDRAWSSGARSGWLRNRALHQSLRLQARLVAAARPRHAGADAIYLLTSHHHLDRPHAIRRYLAASGARFVAFVHDLIPLEWPEYARPGHDLRHRRRIESVAALADGIVTNSAATAASLKPYLERAGRTPVLRPALLGIADGTHAAPADTVAALKPYFICVGTIEPRKNHLMLLALWRDLVQRLGAGAPRLILVGKRGWENENIADLLDRSPAIRRAVEEHNALPDDRLRQLMAGARALLLPSFAEGFGLPVGEALALGVPVICSDLPALREVGGDVPDYLDPLDIPGWRTAILDYLPGETSRRDAQLRRLRHWRAPRWDTHFQVLDSVFDAVLGGAPPAIQERAQ